MRRPSASPPGPSRPCPPRAPSPHNTQPWLFEVVSETEAHLYFDRDRRLVHTDPPIRQGHLGHGTLLETVRLAAPLFGHRAEIELLPAGEMSPKNYGERPTATIRVVADPTPVIDPLAEFLLTRRSSRLAHEGAPVTAAQAEAIVSEAGVPEGVSVEVIRDDRVDPLKTIAKEAMAVEVEDDTLYGDTLTWFRFTPEEIEAEGDGLNLQTANSDTAVARAFLSPNNWYARINRNVYSRRFDAVIDSAPAFVALSTRANTMHDWLVAGAGWLRVQLAGTRQGLYMHPLSQILQEFPQMDPLRPRMEALLPREAPGRVQMFARISRGRVPPRSPRRELDAMLVDAS